jgi:hypothetical protein
MANLRADLLNELRNQKYYAEMELVRLAQDGTMNYREKIDALDDVLTDIALLNQKMALADGYFAQPEQAAPAANVPDAPAEEENPATQQPVAEQPQVVPAPAPAAHPGQSHGE